MTYRNQQRNFKIMNYLFSYTGVHLCVNCENKQSCIYSAGHDLTKKDISSCEEYTLPRTEKRKVSSELKEEAIPTELYMGICTSCDHLNNCSLRQKDSITLSCEHYK